jgi:DNA invertase Pin-like site-specific DNA recombinase
LGCDPISRRQEALSLLSTGKSWQAVAEQTGISRAGVYRLKKELPK